MDAGRCDGGLSVLILNWRDLRHPRAGGAEVLTHGHARRLVERGHRVTMFVGAAEGAPAEDEVDGVHVVRRGGAVSTRAHALRWYRGQLRRGERFDIVVEEVNTLPYLFGRLTGAPTLLWIHQLAREVWWHEAPRLLAPIGYALEGRYVRLYRSLPAVVSSESTKADLLEMGFRENAVTVVRPAIDPAKLPAETAKEQGLLVYVGRLTPSKRVPHLIQALSRVREAGIDARLDLVGTGDARVREALEREALELGLGEHVRFSGFVEERAKRELLARASLLLMASVREGWGLAVTEANSLGTPAVVYDRPGLRDSTVHERTGLITAPDPASLANGIIRALQEPGLYDRLRTGALDWARSLSWDRASVAFEEALVAASRTRSSSPT